jgi:predicted DNA-binding WGR domain protein
MTVLRTNLWFYAGSSDKVYIVTLLLTNGVYTVAAQWGRRGNTMQSQIKGNFASEWAARREFHSLVASKTAKGYRVTEAVGA